MQYAARRVAELDPRTVYTDTHEYTEVVMATAALLGNALAPRIARMHELTLYKVDRSRHYTQLDPILDGTVKPHLVRRAWDETNERLVPYSAATGALLQAYLAERRLLSRARGPLSSQSLTVTDR